MLVYVIYYVMYVCVDSIEFDGSLMSWWDGVRDSLEGQVVATVYICVWRQEEGGWVRGRVRKEEEVEGDRFQRSVGSSQKDKEF